ncbi:MAG: transcriptional repressor [Thermoleophilia bacterium]
MKLLANARLYSVEAMVPARGMPFTRQRRTIFDYFAAADRAVTMAEAVHALELEGIGQATVYRTVALLAELGLLVWVQASGGQQCLVATGVGH